MIDLTREHLKTSDARPLDVIRALFEPHAFYASTLDEVRRHFDKRSGRDGVSAYVFMRNLRAQLIDEVEHREFLLEDRPYFLITDGVNHRVAAWCAGGLQEYLSAREEFSFSTGAPVPIPRTWLAYYAHEDFFTIKSMDRYAASPERKRLSIYAPLLEALP